MRLFKGAWLPDPLMIACVAASLSHNWMYVEVTSGLIRYGRDNGCPCFEEIDEGLVAGKVFEESSVVLSHEIPRVSVADGWKTTAAHPLVISEEGVSSCC